MKKAGIFDVLDDPSVTMSTRVSSLLALSSAIITAIAPACSALTAFERNEQTLPTTTKHQHKTKTEELDMKYK